MAKPLKIPDRERVLVKAVVVFIVDREPPFPGATDIHIVQQRRGGHIILVEVLLHHVVPVTTAFDGIKRLAGHLGPQHSRAAAAIF